MNQSNILELFSERVAEFGDRTAIRRAAESVTYSELDARSNVLANYLIASGVQKGTVVAVLMEDAFATISSILGILKAACVFVPLDPGIPEKRLMAMTALVAARWIIFEPKFFALADNIMADGSAQVRFFCTEPGPLADAAHRQVESIPWEADVSGAKPPASQSEPDDICYVYFTSGSSGEPKGIAGRLKGIDHFIRWEIKHLDVGPETRVSQLLPYSFDGSLRDIFIPLCAGGTVCVPPSRDTILDAEELIHWLDEQQINIIHCVPSLFRSIINEAPGPELFAALRYVLMAGEPLLPSDVKRWMDVFGERVQLVNLYGTSETTMAKFIYYVKASDTGRRSIPIGKPMPGASALVVDSRGRPCPAGTVGEIYIRTPYRSLGYYNRPELTKEVFISNPFNNDLSDVVYKTGDMGRVLEDGNYEYLGRLDQQVKIRGQRVELAEVEGLLRSCEPVRDVAVVDREDASGYKYLCAYVVLDDEEATGKLRDYCAASLPDYMVPSAFVLMSELPQTISGKIDRRALATLGPPQIASEQPFCPPRTPLEELLCGIWAQVLGLASVGIRDNFFHSGGHSLLATQVVSRLRVALDAEVTLRDLFEAPTVEELARRIGASYPAGSGPGVEPTPEIRPRSEGNKTPRLSFAQQRLWFLDQLEPGSALYNIPAAIRLSGHLDVQALTETLSEITRRHEALRTTFRDQAGEPVQVIHGSTTVSLPVTDLRGFESNSLKAEVARRAQKAANEPFVLSDGPLFRVELLRLSDDEHVLLCTMHHIISDGWSLGVLVKEVAALYQAYTSGAPSPLAELPIQYADYAAWQREWGQGEKLGQQLAYWKKQLDGVAAALELPTDKPRPPVPTYSGSSLPVSLGPVVTEGLKILSRREGMTLFMTLLAAWQALLFRYSGQADIVVGTDIANRNRHETEPLIGFFVNQLVLRGRLTSELSFRELLRQTREVCLGAFAHQDLPFEKLVEELRPDRDLSRAPLFQVKLVLQNAPLEPLRLPRLQLSSLEGIGQSGKAKFDLTLMLEETATGLAGILEYSTDLFESASMERLLAHFQQLLQGIIAEPNRQLGLLPLLSLVQSDQVLFEWNQTVADFPNQASPAQLFEQQVLRTPAATALVMGQSSLTYTELNARANQLARHFRELGVGPEVIVGIYMPRSVDLVVTLLAVLKAGGAYLPIDVQWPLTRLSSVLEDASVAVLATSADLEQQLPAHWAQVVCVSQEWAQLAQHNAENLQPVGHPDNLAYIIYTSGSTGGPKGVMISRRSLVNYLWWSRTAYPFSSGISAPMHSPLSFDLTVTTLYGPLLMGGTVELLAEGDELESLRAAWQRARPYDVVKVTPAHLQMLSLLSPRTWSSGGARALVIGGEQLLAETVQRWHEFDAGAEIINEYGPTEAVVGCCVYRIKGSGPQQATIPIGKPIANMQMYVFDKWQEPVPVGVIGEIYIGGEGLARGYVQRPEMTAEQFVPHLHSREAGARLYRTGDLGRYRADGNIEFLGRSDRQVKVRGYRVELEEVETELARHPAIAECVVEVREAASGDNRLVAYIVAGSEARSTDAELREYLREKLPEYMLPSLFVRLDALPLTAHGKVDRRALPAPESERADVGDLARPRTAVEEFVAGIWSEVLDIGQFGTDENFFDLGGHSLLATQVISRLGAAFKMDLPLRLLFEQPTVAALSATLTQMRQDSAALPAPPIVPVGREWPLPLSFAQQRLWFLDQVDPGFTAYHVPIALRVEGPLDAQALRGAFSEIARRHEMLRTTFDWMDGAPTQIIHDAQELEFRMIELSGLDDSDREAEVLRLVNAEAHELFNLRLGPLMRLKLLRLGAAEHVLLCTMHHIISDAWSIGVLGGEVAALYRAFALKQPSPLSDLSVQYADYAVWQRQWLEGEVLDHHLTYWRDQLAGIATVSGLPTDRPRPVMQSYRGAALSWTLDAELSEALRRLSRKESCTMFMMLLAGLAVLLSRHSGEREIIVGAPIAGRTQIETENLIGFFINTLVLRADLSGDPTFAELLMRVRELALDAYTHQEIPFEKLVEELRPERSLAHTPLFQVMLDVRTTDAEPPELPGLTLKTMSGGSASAKFDLEFSLADTGQKELTGEIIYSTELYHGWTIKHLIDRWQQLLSSVVADPKQPISRLQLLSEDDRSRLREWNLSTADYPADRCVHELFETQTERTPSNAAVVFENQQLSYAELNARANKVAHALMSRHVCPEAIVAVLMERTEDFPVAMLGVFKAGGAYLPLDPLHPVRRIQEVMVQSRPKVLLTSRKFEPLLSQAMNDWVDGDCPEVMFVEEVLRQNFSTDNPHGAGAPHNLAYVIYTSGSTGKPKGAMVEHQGMLNHLCAKVAELDLTGADVVAQTASQCFDISVWQFLSPLLVGGCARIVSDRITHDPIRLLDEIENGKISILELVPALLRTALENMAILRVEGRSLSALRCLILTGEALPPDLCRLWLGQYEQIPLLNAYGPTECSDDVTHHRIILPPSEEEVYVPIGRPIGNMRTYILDDYQQPVPIGVKGELYVGGVGVGRGYLNDPSQTAEVFVPDSFGPEAGGRLYRTGDLARHRPDGPIEYLGRADDQVKVRGFRIELGEIEAALNLHPEIRESIVVATENASGDSRLVAYFVPHQALPVSVAPQEFLRERLPGYMIPSAFIRLDQMPLTPNGKIDRRALPAPVLDRQGVFIAPETEIEKAQAALWAEVLKVEQVGLEDNFFDLGGHSLGATQLLTRIAANVGVELTLADFFATPTVRAVSQKIESALLAQMSSSELDRMLSALEEMGDEEAESLLTIDDARNQSR